MYFNVLQCTLHRYQKQALAAKGLVFPLTKHTGMWHIGGEAATLYNIFSVAKYVYTLRNENIHR